MRTYGGCFVCRINEGGNGKTGIFLGKETVMEFYTIIILMTGQSLTNISDWPVELNARKTGAGYSLLFPSPTD